MYDPIGLVAPYTVKARLLLKDIWRLSGQQWDNDLPPEVVSKFLDWSQELPGLSGYQVSYQVIPRPYFQGKVETLELHLFGDSSQDVFSAVAFLRAKVVNKENQEQTQLAFVFGKARVAPMKALTIPKLELQASLLAARLRKEVEKALTLEISKTCKWSGSTTVLQWIHSLDKQPVFVANRVAEILDFAATDEWNYVKSSENPADAGTRGLSAKTLLDSSWLKGPEFLKTSDWPFKPLEPAKFKLKPDINDKSTEKLFPKDETSLSSNADINTSTFEWHK